MIGDYSAFFKNKQGMFEGIKKRLSNQEMAMQKMLVIWVLLK